MRNNKRRFIYMILVGILISLLLNAVVPYPVHDHSRIHDFLISIIITIIVWEGNLRIDTLMNERYPWLIKPRKRIFIHLPVSLVFSVFAIYLPMLVFDTYICSAPIINRGALVSSSIAIGVLITFIILSVEISSQFFYHWKNSLVEVEKYKAESTLAQLQNLKSQVNPHFLFNNMSILSSLVYKDQDKAVDFINQLSKVYRYLLDNRSDELVTLDSELAFIKSYTYLLQIRFDASIIFDFKVDNDKLQLLIPPMSLQMLIENAIKHNVVSSENPLTISVFTAQDKLIVSNNLQLRSNPENSTKSGFENIKGRYQFYTDREVEVVQTDNLFTVKIPLLSPK